MWLDDAPAAAKWLGIRGAILAHAYWVGFGFVCYFTTHYYYPMLLVVEYLTEPVIWHCTRAFLHGKDGFAPPAILTMISDDFTLEVELAGAFLGFFLFHYKYNRAGTKLLGSLGFVVALGGVIPIILIFVGAIYSPTPTVNYFVFWLIGVLGGIGRAGAIVTLFVQRLDTWRYLSKRAQSSSLKTKRSWSLQIIQWLLCSVDANSFDPLIHKRTQSVLA